MCDMKIRKEGVVVDCPYPAIETLEIYEHPEIREELGLPVEAKQLKVCRYHVLVWRIGWLLNDYGYPLSINAVKKMLDAVNLFPETNPYL